MCISGPSWCYVQHNKSGIILNLGSELPYFCCQQAFKTNQVSKLALISKLHVQKLFSKTLGTCHARLDTFPRGIWIPSASLSMASFTFKLQHFNVMLSLGLLTHSLSTFGLNQSQGRRNAWGPHVPPPPIFFRYIFHCSMTNDHSVDSKDFPRLLLNFIFCPCQIWSPSYAPDQAGHRTGLGLSPLAAHSVRGAKGYQM